jgi:hypothetical protein
VTKKRSFDQCHVRGCGGWVPFENPTFDGSIEYCGRCHREHTAHVAYDDSPVRITLGRKPRAATKQRGVRK